MRSVLASLFIAAALAAATAVDARQQPTEPPPGGGAAAPALGAHAGMRGGGCLAMSDERLETVKRELGITAAQMPRWNAFAEAVRSNARGMGRMGSMGHMGAGRAASQQATLPQRLEMHERMIAQHLEALRRVKAPLLSLYDSFTPVQKAKADAMCGPHGEKSQAH